MATPAGPPANPVDAPTAAPPIAPMIVPPAAFLVRFVPWCRPAPSALASQAAIMSCPISFPYKRSREFDLRIGSGPAQAMRFMSRRREIRHVKRIFTSYTRAGLEQPPPDALLASGYGSKE